MGMFDYVKYKYDCPNCGTEVKEFQSKDSVCELKELLPKDVDFFYGECKGCGKKLQFETDITRILNSVSIIKCGDSYWD